MICPECYNARDYKLCISCGTCSICCDCEGITMTPIEPKIAQCFQCERQDVHIRYQPRRIADFSYRKNTMNIVQSNRKQSVKKARKLLADQQPYRCTFLREFDFQKARHCHRIATIFVDLALWNGSRSRKDRQKDLADYLKAKAAYRACLLWIRAIRLTYQSNNNYSIWRPIGGDSRRTEL